MDLSAVIFLAVAVAWAVYLVPKALRHHDEAHDSRSVDRFSHTVRVLARREAVSARDARFVVPQRAPRAAATEAQTETRTVGQDTRRGAGRDDERGAVPEPQPAPAPPSAAQLRARRLAAQRATRRRRRVLGVLLGANAVVGALAVLGVVAVVWPALPAGLLAAWLVTCRVMVRGERAAWESLTAPGTVTPPPATDQADDRDDQDDEADQTPTDDVPRTDAVVADEGFAEVAPPSGTTADEPAPAGPPLWDPVPVTLPTYVHKAAAVRRSVRTIDLDATGVWTSGRTDEDARIAQASAKRVAREAGGDADQAVGS